MTLNKLISIFFLLFYFFLVSCNIFKPVQSFPNNSVYVNYDKVRLTIHSGDIEYNLKGYINNRLDTDFCFRFFSSPFGTEVIKGIIGNDIWIYDAFDKTEITDMKAKIENLFGVSFVPVCFQYLLLGDIHNFDSILMINNKSIIQISSKYTRSNQAVRMDFYNTVSKRKLNVRYKWKNNYPSYISITSDDVKNPVNIQFEILSISYERKLCNFKVAN